MSKKTKWRTELPEGLACPIPPSVGPIFAGRGRVISGRRTNTFASRFATTTKLLRGVFGPISMPNDYLNTVFDDVVSLCGSCRNNALPIPCVRKVFPYKKGITEEYATCRSPRQIETLEGLQMQYPKEIKLKLAENYCLKKVFFVTPK